jgi:hypothetical protein
MLLKGSFNSDKLEIQLGELSFKLDENNGEVLRLSGEHKTFSNRVHEMKALTQLHLCIVGATVSDDKFVRMTNSLVESKTYVANIDSAVVNGSFSPELNELITKYHQF